MASVLISGDHRALSSLWKRIAPHLPQPADEEQAKIMLHRARTEAEVVPLSLRAYSHRWLIERDIASGLPDRFRPMAERMYPRREETVGIICVARSPLFAPISKLVERAAADAVSDLYSSSKRPADEAVKSAIGEARKKTVKKLLGRT